MVSKNLSAASTKPLILAVLKRGKSYGYKIINDVRELSGGSMQWSDGMLYPVLHRLEKEGFIESDWYLEKDQRPRKYYGITEKGKKELLSEKEQWIMVHKVLVKAWE